MQVEEEDRQEPVVVEDPKPGKAEPDRLAEMAAEAKKHKDEAAAEKGRAEVAVRERDEARKQAQATADRAVEAEETAIKNYIAAKDRDRNTLQRDYQEALAKQDFGKAAEINDRLLDVKADIREANQRKDGLERWKKDAVAKAEAAPKNPLDAYTPTTRAWLEAHPDAQPGARYWNRAQAAHAVAIDEGLRADTPEYFARVEQIVYPKAVQPQPEPEVEEVEERPVREQRREVAPAAAPPSRGNGGGGPKADTSQRYRLTQAEKDIALRGSNGKTPEEKMRNYALTRERLKAEGRYHAPTQH